MKRFSILIFVFVLSSCNIVIRPKKSTSISSSSIINSSEMSSQTSSEIENTSKGSNSDDSNPTVVYEDLIIHTINTGQADGIFIELPNGETILIDGGKATGNYKHSTINYIKDEVGKPKIDYMIGTHPHEDHLGTWQFVLDPSYGLEVENIYMPWRGATTAFFKNFLANAEKYEIPIHPVNDGLKLIDDQELGLSVEFLGPDCKTGDEHSINSSTGSLTPKCSVSELSTDDINSHSAITLIKYQDVKILFMGDGSGPTEKDLMNRHLAEIDADILKVGHHGAQTYDTNARPFLNAVSPTYALLTPGHGNSYGHPTKAALDNLAAQDGGNVPSENILRTDHLAPDSSIKSIVCTVNLTYSCEYNI